jgi:hypothetical protein
VNKRGNEVFLKSKNGLPNRENCFFRMPNNTFDKIIICMDYYYAWKHQFVWKWRHDKLNQLWLLFWNLLQLLGAKNNLALTSTFVVQNWWPWSSSKSSYIFQWSIFFLQFQDWSYYSFFWSNFLINFKNITNASLDMISPTNLSFYKELFC